MRRKTTEQFISESIAIFGEGMFDYSKAEYRNTHTPITLICKNGHEINPLPSNHLRGFGCQYCSYEQSKSNPYKYGINDLHLQGNSQCAKTWRHMLERCYDDKLKRKYPTYRDCSVCDEWLTLSSFKKWFDENYIEGYALDKDIIVKGNKVYSPKTCCFIPPEINSIFRVHPKNKNNLPRGVVFKGKSYVATGRFSGEYFRSPKYSTPEEAFLAYKKAKEQHIKVLAEKYFKEGKITERVYNALLNYRVEITD